MTIEQQNQTGTETCMIMIMFPVDTDERALMVKTKIKEVIGNIEGLRFDFRITATPNR